jgi:hypothetical protein
MIAAFTTNPTISIEMLHAVFNVARQGLKVKSHGYCGTEGNAAEGTYQVPDWAFDGRPTYRPIENTIVQGPTWHVCSKCSEAMKRLREPPR